MKVSSDKSRMRDQSLHRPIRVLVTGGAGCAGSDAANLFSRASRDLIVLGNQSTGVLHLPFCAGALAAGQHGNPSPQIVDSLVEPPADSAGARIWL